MSNYTEAKQKLEQLQAEAKELDAKKHELSSEIAALKEKDRQIKADFKKAVDVSDMDLQTKLLVKSTTKTGARIASKSIKESITKCEKEILNITLKRTILDSAISKQKEIVKEEEIKMEEEKRKQDPNYYNEEMLKIEREKLEIERTNSKHQFLKDSLGL